MGGGGWQSCRTEPLAVGSDAISREIVSELSCRTLAGVGELPGSVLVVLYAINLHNKPMKCTLFYR